MEWYSYQKKRYEMGKAPNFTDTELKLYGYIPSPNLQPNWNYVERDPKYIVFDNIPELSEHTVFPIFLSRSIPREFALLRML